MRLAMQLTCKGLPPPPIDTLAAAFSQWLLEVAGLSLEQVLTARLFDSEVVCGYMVQYGRDLYRSGRPYWHYAETVN